MKVVKVEAAKDKDYFFDIEVDDVHEYILSNGLVVHNSSLSTGTTNGVYPVRETSLMKTDNKRNNYWVAPDSERLEKWYESAWDLETKDLIDAYAIIQKFTDQAISADLYRKIGAGDYVTSTEVLEHFIYRVKMGVKTRYYQNSKTSSGMKATISDVPSIPTLDPNVPIFVESDDDDYCESCTL